MIRKYDLPEEIVLPCGTVLKAIMGDHYSGQNVRFMPKHPGGFWTDEDIAKEAKARGLKYRRVSVLSRNLRGKIDLHGRPYRPSYWMFVEGPK